MAVHEFQNAPRQEGRFGVSDAGFRFGPHFFPASTSHPGAQLGSAAMECGKETQNRAFTAKTDPEFSTRHRLSAGENVDRGRSGVDVGESAWQGLVRLRTWRKVCSGARSIRIRSAGAAATGCQSHQQSRDAQPPWGDGASQGAERKLVAAAAGAIAPATSIGPEAAVIARAFRGDAIALRVQHNEAPRALAGAGRLQP